MKTCYFCKGHVSRKNIDYMARRGNQYMLVKNLPADVCDQCGEVYLDIESSHRVDNALHQSSKAKEYLSIPIVSCI